ncbi:MAG TPA: hypothetical protein VHF50_04275 [Solirubrobacterales bacterium]|nr:hypothetical protein [Solirubrobacterales bacterium]
MAVASRRETTVTPPEEAGQDFYESTRFWSAARAYGFDQLILTWATAVALAFAGGVLFLFLNGDLPLTGVKALAVAYVSLGAALFGIVLAGFAVVAAFFDRDYVSKLQEAGTLGNSLFGFWWVAAITVLAVLTSVGLTVAAFVGASEPVTAVALGIATTLFVASLGEALSLVGTIMRHALYRSKLARRDIRITQQEP